MVEQTTGPLVRLTVEAFLDRLAARTPAPGGGAVAATTGALSAALGRMVLAYSVGKKTADDDRARLTGWAEALAKADTNLRRLVDDDAAAYAAYSALTQSKDTGALAEKAKAQALAAALEVPLAIAAVAEGVLACFQEAAPRASSWMLSDLAAAGILAEATVRCAGCSVRVNADQMQDATLAEAARVGQARLEASAQQRLADLLAGLRSPRNT